MVTSTVEILINAIYTQLREEEYSDPDLGLSEVLSNWEEWEHEDRAKKLDGYAPLIPALVENDIKMGARVSAEGLTRMLQVLQASPAKARHNQSKDGEWPQPGEAWKMPESPSWRELALGFAVWSGALAAAPLPAKRGKVTPLAAEETTRALGLMGYTRLVRSIVSARPDLLLSKPKNETCWLMHAAVRWNDRALMDNILPHLDRFPANDLSEYVRDEETVHYLIENGVKLASGKNLQHVLSRNMPENKARKISSLIVALQESPVMQLRRALEFCNLDLMEKALSAGASPVKREGKWEMGVGSQMAVEIRDLMQTEREGWHSHIFQLAKEMGAKEMAPGILERDFVGAALSFRVALMEHEFEENEDGWSASEEKSFKRLRQKFNAELKTLRYVRPTPSVILQMCAAAEVAGASSARQKWAETMLMMVCEPLLQKGKGLHKGPLDAAEGRAIARLAKLAWDPKEKDFSERILAQAGRGMDQWGFHAVRLKGGTLTGEEMLWLGVLQAFTSYGSDEKPLPKSYGVQIGKIEMPAGAEDQKLLRSLLKSTEWDNLHGSWQELPQKIERALQLSALKQSVATPQSGARRRM